ncbi:MAG TPA: thioredoxin domain-containing protein, partial [Microthrixaceae bacterium]|nr:thioredoxin domain-containing protein [Microthrixaceae bacterium]
AEYGDKIEIVKLDTDNNPTVTARYGVTGIPTMNLYVGGEVVKTIVGAKPKRLLLRELEPFLS